MYLKIDHFECSEYFHFLDLKDLDIPEVDDLCTKLQCKVKKDQVEL